MKTYPLKDDNSFQFCFEIENVYIGINRIVKLLSNVKGVSNIKKRRLFVFSNENHIEFDYLGDRFVVLEPYGDSSRYWICPKNMPHRKIDISDIEFVFRQYKPPILIKLLGDIVTLKFRNIITIL